MKAALLLSVGSASTFNLSNKQSEGHTVLTLEVEQGAYCVSDAKLLELKFLWTPRRAKQILPNAPGIRTLAITGAVCWIIPQRAQEIKVAGAQPGRRSHLDPPLHSHTDADAQEHLQEKTSN